MAPALVRGFIEPIETPIERIKRLQQEVSDLALEQRGHLIKQLLIDADHCKEVASMESLPAGVREVLRRLAETIQNEVQGIQSITVRNA